MRESCSSYLGQLILVHSVELVWSDVFGVDRAQRVSMIVITNPKRLEKLLPLLGFPFLQLLHVLLV